MWRPYTELAQTFFPNATIIVDKYHFIRQVTFIHRDALMGELFRVLAE